MLPDNVRNILRDHLTSFECLELLLLLYRRSGEPASLAALSRESGIGPDLALDALLSLESSQLVRRSLSEPTTFRYAAATAELGDAVADLERVYRDQHAAVMSEMSLNAIGRIRSGTLRAFSDAFVLGKKKRDSDG
jgi:hypothetical protein